MPFAELPFLLSLVMRMWAVPAQAGFLALWPCSAVTRFPVKRKVSALPFQHKKYQKKRVTTQDGSNPFSGNSEATYFFKPYESYKAVSNCVTRLGGAHAPEPAKKPLHYPPLLLRHVWGIEFQSVRLRRIGGSFAAFSFFLNNDVSIPTGTIKKRGETPRSTLD